MTVSLGIAPAVTDPPDELTALPPRPAEGASEGTCARCSNPATLRYTGHPQKEALRAPGREPCRAPRPYQLCINCYMGWFNYYLRGWYAKGYAECIYCDAQGDTIEVLFPYETIA